MSVYNPHINLTNLKNIRYSTYTSSKIKGVIAGKMSKSKVKCIETGEKFSSMEKAALKFNMHASGISRSARLDVKVKGFTFKKI